MKIIEQDASRMIMRDRDLFMKLWYIGMPVFCSIVVVFLLRDYHPSIQPAVVLCFVFIAMGLFGLIFMQKQLTYEFDKTLDKVNIYYPARFATKFDVESFPLSELKCIMKKVAVGFRSGDNSPSNTRPYLASGFDFVLKSGKRIHCGIYSSNHKDITDIINKVTSFVDVPVLEEEETDEDIDVLMG